MVLKEVVEASPSASSEASFPVEGSTDDGRDRTIPIGKLGRYVNSTVSFESLPWFAPFVGFSAGRAQKYLQDQLELFSFAAHRDLRESECEVLIAEDLRVRTTSASVMAAALLGGFVHLARSHRLAKPIPFQTRFPAAYKTLGRFGPLTGTAAAAAWASVRVALYVPIWVVAAQMAVLPLVAMSAIRASRAPELKQLNEEIRQELADLGRRGVSIALVARNASDAARKAEAAVEAGETGETNGRETYGNTSRSGENGSSVLDRLPTPFPHDDHSVLDDFVQDQPEDGPSDRSEPRSRSSRSRRREAASPSSWDNVRTSTRTENHTSGRDDGDDGDGHNPSHTSGSWDAVRQQSIAARRAVEDGRRE